MSHPHPGLPPDQHRHDDDTRPDLPADSEEHPVPTGYHPEQLDAEDVENRAAPRRARQWTVAALLVGLLVLLAGWAAWAHLQDRREARTTRAAAGKLCDQVQGMGQPCVVDPTTGEQVAGGLAQVPAAAPTSAPPLPGRPTPTRAAASTVPDESAAQAGQPDGPYTNPDPAVVGLAVVDGRLQITYDDGTVVDAGRLTGPPPAIVVPVPERGAAPSSPAAASSSPPAVTSAPAQVPAPTAEATE